MTDRPKPSKLQKDVIGQIAEHFSCKYNVIDREISDVVDDIGGAIEYRDFWADSSAPSGSLYVEGNRPFQIIIPMHTSMTRDRFTVAHELGHYFMHYVFHRAKGDPVARLVANRYGSGRVEWEANWFAASFLMPKELFKKAVIEFDNDIGAVASKFGVSREAALIRQKVLNTETAGERAEN